MKLVPVTSLCFSLPLSTTQRVAYSRDGRTVGRGGVDYSLEVGGGEETPSLSNLVFICSEKLGPPAGTALSVQLHANINIVAFRSSPRNGSKNYVVQINMVLGAKEEKRKTKTFCTHSEW